jgi:hypothetical protein
MRILLTISLMAVIRFASAQAYNGWDSVNVNLNGNNFDMLVKLPTNYVDSPSKRYPIIIFFHGVGEAGNDLNLLFNAGMLRRNEQQSWNGNITLANGTLVQYIRVAPQGANSSYWNDCTKSNTLLEYLLAHYRIDTANKKIHLTGLSQGGTDITKQVLGNAFCDTTYRKYIRSFAPMSKGFNSSEYARFPTLTPFRVWAGHGNEPSGGTPTSESIALVDSVRKYNTSMPANYSRFVQLPGAHDNTCWDSAYSVSGATAATNIYRWFADPRDGIIDRCSGAEQKIPVNWRMLYVASGADQNSYDSAFSLFDGDFDPAVNQFDFDLSTPGTQVDRTHVLLFRETVRYSRDNIMVINLQKPYWITKAWKLDSSSGTGTIKYFKNLRAIDPGIISHFKDSTADRTITGSGGTQGWSELFSEQQDSTQFLALGFMDNNADLHNIVLYGCPVLSVTADTDLNYLTDAELAAITKPKYPMSELIGLNQHAPTVDSMWRGIIYGRGYHYMPHLNRNQGSLSMMPYGAPGYWQPDSVLAGEGKKLVASISGAVYHVFQQTGVEKYVMLNDTASDPTNIKSYDSAALIFHFFTAVFGNNQSYPNPSYIKVSDGPRILGRNQYFATEDDNEDNASNFFVERFQTPWRRAIRSIAVHDSSWSKSGTPAIKNADPNMIHINGGMVSGRYNDLRETIFFARLWMKKFNRAKLGDPYDAWNIHYTNTLKRMMRLPTSSEQVGDRGVNPEFWDTRKIVDSVHDEFIRVARMFKDIWVTEYAANKQFRFTATQADVDGGISNLSVPHYDTLNQFFSHDRQMKRELLHFWAAGVRHAFYYSSHDDHGYKLDPQYFWRDASNGMFQIDGGVGDDRDTTCRWPVGFSYANFGERLAKYYVVKDSIHAPTKLWYIIAKHKDFADSFLIIPLKRDTLSGSGITLVSPALGSTSIQEWVPDNQGYNNGTNSIPVIGGNFTVSVGTAGRFFFGKQITIPPPPPPPPPPGGLLMNRRGLVVPPPH